MYLITKKCDFIQYLAGLANYSGWFFNIKYELKEICQWIPHCVLKQYANLYQMYFYFAENDRKAVALFYTVMFQAKFGLPKVNFSKLIFRVWFGKDGRYAAYCNILWEIV